tara:strand:+ start:129 stop:932 length:804 start_codon:yes stop_codon:yes gene_type:complete
MESEGLKQFLKIVGDAVYNLNTICVGLEGVSSGSITKAEDLTITWTTKDPKRTAMSARRFAIRSSLVFVEEALSDYIDFLSKCANQTQKIKNACDTEGAVERVSKLSKNTGGQEEYWLPFVILMIRWRNKVVHNSTTNFSPIHRKTILNNSSLIKERHAAINVEETLNNFDHKKITLKDFSTMMAITIRFIRHIDSELKPTVADVDSLRNQIIERELDGVYKRVIGVNGEKKQKSKFRAFINSNFTSIGDAEFDELFKVRYEIAREN